MNPFLILRSFYHSGVYEPEVVEEVHGGEGDGDHTEHEVRHRQVEDEEIAGVAVSSPALGQKKYVTCGQWSGASYK